VRYRCRYFTINSNISEHDHQCETWNVEPEIGTHRSSLTRRNPSFDGTGPGLARQELADWFFGRVWDQTDRFLLSKPGQLADYPDPLLTLESLDIKRVYSDLWEENISTCSTLQLCQHRSHHNPESSYFTALKTTPLSIHVVLFGLLWSTTYRSILQAASYTTESRYHSMYTLD